MRLVHVHHAPQFGHPRPFAVPAFLDRPAKIVSQGVVGGHPAEGQHGGGGMGGIEHQVAGAEDAQEKRSDESQVPDPVEFEFLRALAEDPGGDAGCARR